MRANFNWTFSSIFCASLYISECNKSSTIMCELDQGLIKDYERHCEKFIHNVFVPFNRAIVYYREMKFNQYLDMDVFKPVDVEKNENELQVNERSQPITKEVQEVRKKKGKVIRADIVNKRKAQVAKDM